MLESLTIISLNLRIDELTFSLWIQRSAAESELKLWDKVLISASKAIEMKPASLVALLHRGTAFQELGNIQNAVNDFARALVLDTNHTTAHKRLASALTLLSGATMSLSSSHKNELVQHHTDSKKIQENEETRRREEEEEARRLEEEKEKKRQREIYKKEKKERKRQEREKRKMEKERTRAEKKAREKAEKLASEKIQKMHREMKKFERIDSLSRLWKGPNVGDASEMNLDMFKLFSDFMVLHEKPGSCAFLYTWNIYDLEDSYTYTFRRNTNNELRFESEERCLCDDVTCSRNVLLDFNTMMKRQYNQNERYVSVLLMRSGEREKNYMWSFLSYKDSFDQVYCEILSRKQSTYCFLRGSTGAVGSGHPFELEGIQFGGVRTDNDVQEICQLHANQMCRDVRGMCPFKHSTKNGKVIPWKSSHFQNILEVVSLHVPHLALCVNSLNNLELHNNYVNAYYQDVYSYEKSLQRMKSVFSGIVSSPPNYLLGPRLKLMDFLRKKMSEFPIKGLINSGFALFYPSCAEDDMFEQVYGQSLDRPGFVVRYDKCVVLLCLCWMLESETLEHLALSLSLSLSHTHTYTHTLSSSDTPKRCVSGA